MIPRKRRVSLPPFDMIKLGEEMVDWIEKENPIHLSHWYTIEKGYTYNEWKTYIQCEEFKPYYEIALRMVGKKYIDGTIHPSIAQRFLRNYFKDLKEEEDAKTKFEHDLKVQEQTVISEEALKRHNALISQIQSLQSERNSAPINNSAESKS
jgi:hypothetical protein